MTILDAIDIVESSSIENALSLVEKERDGILRAKMRNLFFQALDEIKNHNHLSQYLWND